MTFTTFVHSLVERWRLVVGCLLAGLALGWGVSALATPTYTSTSTLLLTAASPEGQASLVGLVPTYAEIAEMNTILDPAAAELGRPAEGERLARSVQSVALPGTALVQVSATDARATQAQRIAEVVTRRLAAYLSTSPATRRQVVPSVVELATHPTRPSSASRPKLVASGGVAGLGAGVALALLLGAARPRPSAAAPTDDMDAELRDLLRTPTGRHR